MPTTRKEHIELVNELKLTRIVMRERLDDIIELQQSLNKYHGNPDNEKGWLEGIYDIEKCRKHADKDHRRIGTKFTLFALLIASAALWVQMESEWNIKPFTFLWSYFTGGQL